MAEALRVAILGAECTGKSALAQALGSSLSTRTGLRVAVVDEWLRAWCEAHGRTPTRHEQQGIAEEQQRRIEAAGRAHDVVICDTTPLMTAAYSRWYFEDTSLDSWALAAQERCDLTLLTAIDLPWQPDGIQRDGEHVRAPVDGLLRQLLEGAALRFTVIGGNRRQRLTRALAVLEPALAARGAPAAAKAHGTTRRGRAEPG